MRCVTIMWRLESCQSVREMIFAEISREAGDFLDIEAQLTGTVVDCDAIRYSGMLDGARADAVLREYVQHRF